MNTTTRAVGGALLLLVILLAFNVVAGKLVVGVRADLTGDRLYSLSPGVGPLLRDLDEPVRLDFYFTEDAAADIPQLRAYAQRVDEFLGEITRRSGGAVTLRRLDPEPFSEAEDEARRLGLTQLRGGGGRPLTLGLAAINSVDESEVIPYLDPQRERFLEYEVVRAIVAVARTDKPRVGLIASAPLGGSFDPQTQRPIPAWRIHAQITELFEIESIGPSAASLPDDLDVLMIVHPRNLPEPLQRAIDDWVLSGKPTLVAVDPWCEAVAEPLGGGMQGMNLTQPTVSTFDRFLDAWGLEWSNREVVGDQRLALRVQTGAGQLIDYPVWLRTSGDQLDDDDPITGPLESLTFASTGGLRLADTAGARLAPLVTTTTATQRIPTTKLGLMADPAALVAEFAPSGQEEVLAARLTGPIQSAFPPDPSSNDAGQEGDDASPAPEPPASRTGEANLIILADVDLLADRSWIREERIGQLFLGYSVFADNGAMVMNALEVLSGELALASLRSRGEYTRPFERVEQIRRDAEAEYLAEEQRLEAQIQQTQQQINDLQREKSPDSLLVLSAEQQDRLDELQAEMTEARKRLRAVRLNLRQDVEALGRRMMLFNTLVWPAVVAAAAVGLAIARSMLRRARR